MYRQEYGSYPNSYATYAHPRRRKLDSRGVSSRGTGESDLGVDQSTFHVKFLGSQLMGKEEPNPELVLDLISSLVENLRDDNFRPRSYTVQVTDSEVIICETAAEWTERVPLRVIHYCMQGDNPNSRAFGFVASARQGFMGHVFLARSTAEAKELKKTFYYGFERAFQKYKDKQEDGPRVRQPQVKRVPFVDRPYSAPSYNAYYRYYQPSHYPPHGGAPPRYRVSAQPSEVRYAAGQPFATRYYANREQEAAQRQQEQYYRRSRPNDSFLHEYQYGVGSSQDHPFPETRVRQSRSIPENGYHSPVDRRGRNYRSKTPDPPPRRHHVVSDDMIF